MHQQNGEALAGVRLPMALAEHIARAVATDVRPRLLQPNRPAFHESVCARLDFNKVCLSFRQNILPRLVVGYQGLQVTVA